MRRKNNKKMKLIQNLTGGKVNENLLILIGSDYQ
jgi:hypothetical protein